MADPADTGSGVRATTACRSEANLEVPDRRGLRPGLRRAEPPGRPTPAPIARGAATRARMRGLVEPVFADRKRRRGLVIRRLGPARATAQITLANFA